MNEAEKKTEKRRFGKKSMIIFLIRSVKESAVPKQLTRIR